MFSKLVVGVDAGYQMVAKPEMVSNPLYLLLVGLNRINIQSLDISQGIIIGFAQLSGSVTRSSRREWFEHFRLFIGLTAFSHLLILALMEIGSSILNSSISVYRF